MEQWFYRTYRGGFWYALSIGSYKCLLGKEFYAQLQRVKPAVAGGVVLSRKTGLGASV